MSFSDMLKFEGFNLKNIGKTIKENPEQLFLGAMEPVGGKLWGEILHKDYDEPLNAFGGPNSSTYDKAEAEGIDTGWSESSHDAARIIAAIYAGGYAASAAGAGGAAGAGAGAGAGEGAAAAGAGAGAAGGGGGAAAGAGGAAAGGGAVAGGGGGSAGAGAAAGGGGGGAAAGGGASSSSSGWGNLFGQNSAQTGGAVGNMFGGSKSQQNESNLDNMKAQAELARLLRQRDEDEGRMPGWVNVGYSV